jgi:hypothetical protein
LTDAVPPIAVPLNISPKALFGFDHQLQVIDKTPGSSVGDLFVGIDEVIEGNTDVRERANRKVLVAILQDIADQFRKDTGELRTTGVCELIGIE